MQTVDSPREKLLHAPERKLTVLQLAVGSEDVDDVKGSLVRTRETRLQELCMKDEDGVQPRGSRKLVVESELGFGSVKDERVDFLI